LCNAVKVAAAKGRVDAARGRLAAEKMPCWLAASFSLTHLERTLVLAFDDAPAVIAERLREILEE
jgi:hypothetical protein